jgi:tetratricopeptide (TPR) repeat protein
MVQIKAVQVAPAAWLRLKPPLKKVPRGVLLRSFFRIILPVFAILLLISGLATVFSISASAFESAKALYSQGQKAEARQDYIAAFEAFNKAYQLKPTDLKYRIAFQRTRFLASAAHVNKGQELRKEGKLQEALAEFEYAARIDPSSFVALQEVRRTKRSAEGRARTLAHYSAARAGIGTSGALARFHAADHS